MTIEWGTGFDGCATTADAQAFFDEVDGYARVSYSATGGYDNGPCVYFSQGTYMHPYFLVNCISAKTKCVGAHYNNLPTNDYSTDVNRHLFRFKIGSSYIRVFNTTSGIKVYRDSTLIASSVTESTLINTSLHHIEFKLFSDASAGTIGMKIDGVSVEFDSDSSLNTGGDDITQCLFAGCAYSSGNAYCDNPFISDDWEGEVVWGKYALNSDISNDFTLSTGSDVYTLLETDDGDTSYIESDTIGHEWRCGLETVPSGITVKALSMVSNVKKTDAGLRKLKHRITQDAVDYDGEEFTLTLDYPAAVTEGQYEIMTACPDATALTVAKINAMSFGGEVSA
jgi:ribosomal protein L32